MNPKSPLAPCLIGSGTLTNFRDMLRALETIESASYSFIVDGRTVSEGQAALVKLMADDESSTMIVNGCMFLNVASFRFLDFEQDSDDTWHFTLHGDGMVLELVALPESEEEQTASRPRLLSEELAPDFDVIIALDEDDDEE